MIARVVGVVVFRHLLHLPLWETRDVCCGIRVLRTKS